LSPNAVHGEIAAFRPWLPSNDAIVPWKFA